MVQGSPALQNGALPANALLLTVTCFSNPKGSGALQRHFNLAFQASRDYSSYTSDELTADGSPDELHCARKLFGEHDLVRSAALWDTCHEVLYRS